MSKLNRVMTVGDLRRKLEGVDDSIELTTFIDHKEWPIQGFGIHYKVKDMETRERAGPDMFGMYPTTRGHIEANPDAFSDEVKDKVAVIENICKCDGDKWDWRNCGSKVAANSNLEAAHLS